MNWLGWSGRAMAGALAGALLGAVLSGLAFEHGVQLAWLVGLLAGLGAALLAKEKSPLRGVLVATIAVWAAALRETGASLTIFRFHETMTPTRLASYATCALLALILGGLARTSSAAPVARR
jgi:hypothetical protein